MISATIQKAAETISRLDALRKKMAVAAYLKKKRTAQHTQSRIKERQAAERLIERALEPFFVDQIESAAKALAATVAAPEGIKSTQQTLPTIFNPKDWNRKLVDTLYPAMVKIAVVGMDGEMRRMGLQIKRGLAAVRQVEGELSEKVFCPTGLGGGVDATCKLGERKISFGDIPAQDRQMLISSVADTLDLAENFVRSVVSHLNLSVDMISVEDLKKEIISSHSPDKSKVSEFAEKLKNNEEFEMDPIFVRNGHFFDGGHRVAAYAEAGRKRIPAIEISLLWREIEKYQKSTSIQTKSTATDLLDGLDDSGGLLDMGILETPYGPVNMAFLFEYPDWMKQAISEFLEESFSQPYWDELNKTTLGDIEKYLQEGIKEGWSIEKMATEMAPQLLEQGRYAQIRGRNIARTEAGHALNGARSMGIDFVVAELQGTGLDIQKLWHSVRGTTTRDTHRAIHGVPADSEGMWTLAGHRCRWPGDVTLPANERCNCQCTIESAFGMSDTEARELIALHEGTVAKASWDRLRTKVFESTKCGGPGGTPGPCPLNKPEEKPARKPRKPKVEKPTEEGSDEKPKAKPEKKTVDGLKRFKNGKEAEETLAKSASQWMDGPADDYFANKGVKAYAGTSESFRINDCLRQKCGDKGLSTKAEELKKTIDKASFPESIESHRSINPKTPEERAGILAFFEKNVGQSFVDSAFVSTTANKTYAKTWSKGAKVEPITVSVHVKSGSKAIYIPKDITGRQEWEVLIQSGSRFRVKSIDGGSVVMELENE